MRARCGTDRLRVRRERSSVAGVGDAAWQACHQLRTRRRCGRDAWAALLRLSTLFRHVACVLAVQRSGRPVIRSSRGADAGGRALAQAWRCSPGSTAVSLCSKRWHSRDGTAHRSVLTVAARLCVQRRESICCAAACPLRCTCSQANRQWPMSGCHCVMSDGISFWPFTGPIIAAVCVLHAIEGTCAVREVLNNTPQISDTTHLR